MHTLLGLAAPVLQDQHSLITRRQAIALVGSEAPLRRLLDRGIWERRGRGLFGPVGVADSFERACMAAVLTGPAGTAVSHRAAAVLHGVGGLTDVLPEVTIPRGFSHRPPGVIVHESGDLHQATIVRIAGLPVTDLTRLALDLGSVVSAARFTHTIREIRHRHGVSQDRLLRTYLRHARQGRNGCGALRDWLDRYYGSGGPAESGAEQVVMDALCDAGLPRPTLQFEVLTPGGRFRLDLAWPDRLIAVEVDGAQHDDPDIAAADERRTRLLEAAGWTVLRIRADRLASDLPALVAAVRRLMARPT